MISKCGCVDAKQGHTQVGGAVFSSEDCDCKGKATLESTDIRCCKNSNLRQSGLGPKILMCGRIYWEDAL